MDFQSIHGDYRIHRFDLPDDPTSGFSIKPLGEGCTELNIHRKACRAMLVLAAVASSSKIPGGGYDGPVSERDYAKDYRKRCTVLLPNVQGANTLARLCQCNSNRATSCRDDILLPLVRNVRRTSCRISDKHGLQPGCSQLKVPEYQLAEVDQNASGTRRAI